MEKLLGKHESIPYNPEIANAFFRAGLIESWGRGIERIVETCKKESYPIPEWKVEPNGLWVVFMLEAQANQLETVGKDRLRTIMNDYERLTADERPIATDYDRLRPITTDKKLTTEQIKVIQLVVEKQKVVRKDVVALLGLGDPVTLVAIQLSNL